MIPSRSSWVCSSVCMLWPLYLASPSRKGPSRPHSHPLASALREHVTGCHRVDLGTELINDLPRQIVVVVNEGHTHVERRLNKRRRSLFAYLYGCQRCQQGQQGPNLNLPLLRLLRLLRPARLWAIPHPIIVEGFCCVAGRRRRADADDLRPNAEGSQQPRQATGVKRFTIEVTPRALLQAIQTSGQIGT